MRYLRYRTEGFCLVIPDFGTKLQKVLTCFQLGGEDGKVCSFAADGTLHQTIATFEVPVRSCSCGAGGMYLVGTSHSQIYEIQVRLIHKVQSVTCFGRVGRTTKITARWTPFW